MQRSELITFLRAAVAVWKRAKRPTALLRGAGYLLLGLVSLATVTGLYFWLDVPLVAAAFTYLIVLVLLSLISNLSSLIVLSFIGVGCLSYFFAPPIYSFRVDSPQDIITISAFVITTFAVNFLVTRVRVEQEALRDANQRLEVTNKALWIENVERKRAEQALRESEDKLRQITDTVPGLVWSADPAGEPTQFNQRLLDYSGMRLEDFQHRGWETFLHPADFPETAKALYQAIRTGTSYEVVHRLRRADGAYRWHHARGEPLRDQEGRIIQWYGLSVDIDEGKKAEDQLRRSQAYLAEAERLTHSGSAAYNETKILYLSDEACRLFGFDPLQGVPSREAVWQRIHPDDLDRTNQTIERAVREKKSFGNEFRILLPDGTIRHIEAINDPVFSASGELLEIIATGIDVTERKRAEDTLRESERSARSAIDGIAGLIAIMAANGELETVNRQVFEYFGRSLEELKNWGTSDAVHPEDLPHVVEIFARAVASGNPYHYDQRLRRFDGEYRWFDVRGHPIRDDSGRVARWYVLLTDIEDRVRALAQLEQMQSDFARMNRVATMGQLTASIAHETKQPMAAARNNAQAALNFLDKSPPDVAEVREALTCIVNDADRASDVVDRVGSLIKKAPARKEVVDLNAAILEVTALTRSETVKTGVTVGTQLPGELPRVQCDRVQLQQVMLNLILNAIQSMRDVKDGNRELHISTVSIEPEGVRVEVRDTGPGLSPESLARLFEPFYTTKPDGMGMGLSICRSIIEAHGGRLWATSCEPRGALFQFTIPAD